MKKLIVFSVVFALVAGAGLFAADVGATVFAHINVFETNGVKEGPDDETNLDGTGGLDRLRFEANGGTDTFGAYLRLDGAHWTGGYKGEEWWPVTHSAVWDGLAWWKPIDQFKLNIGNFADGMYGKEGWAGWMFYQMASDCGMVNPANVWDEGGAYHFSGIYRDAFFGGYEINGMSMEITPADIFSLNIGLPFFGGGDLIKDIVGNIMVQGNLNLDFGNIALSYWGGKGADLIAAPDDEDDPAFNSTGRLYLSASIGAIENVGLDIGVGFPVPGGDGDKYVEQKPIAAGLGAKIDVSDAFGIKARVFAAFGGQTTYDGEVGSKDPFSLGFDLLPFFAINDNMKVFVGLGIAMLGKEWDAAAEAEKDDTDKFGFYFNPYMQIGGEWGPCIYFGLHIQAENLNKSGAKQDSSGNDYNPISVKLPIGIQVSY